nr:hypothetical protein [uncultured Roseococcus sp.]
MVAISRWTAAGVLSATLAAGPALATGTVVNHLRLPQGTTIATCLQRAAVAIAASGLHPLNTTQSAAWGQRDGGRIYTIYCIPVNGVAIFVGAGNTSGEVSADVTAMMNAFRSGGTGGGEGGGGGTGSRK